MWAQQSARFTEHWQRGVYKGNIMIVLCMRTYPARRRKLSGEQNLKWGISKYNKKGKFCRSSPLSCPGNENVQSRMIFGKANTTESVVVWSPSWKKCVFLREAESLCLRRWPSYSCRRQTLVCRKERNDVYLHEYLNPDSVLWHLLVNKACQRWWQNHL